MIQEEVSHSKIQHKQVLFVRLATWQRDSHGLFDYESTIVDKLQLKTTTSGFITRKRISGEQSLVNYEEGIDNAIA